MTRIGKALVLLAAVVGAERALAFSMGNPLWPALYGLAQELGSKLSGHEEVVRQAVLLAKANVKSSKFSDDEKDVFFNSNDLKANEDGIIGGNSNNPIIQGNFATDFPTPKAGKSYPIDFNRHWGITFSKEEDWRRDYHTHHMSQVIHGLRNRLPSGHIMNNHLTCTNIREFMQHVARNAMNTWYEAMYLPPAGLKDDSLKNWRRKKLFEAGFWIGHATHTLQDSFSPAHARRGSRAENGDVKDFCFYGNQVEEALRREGREKDYCYHRTIDGGDAVWILTKEQLNNAQENWGHVKGDAPVDKCSNLPFAKLASYRDVPLEKKARCLKHEARLAKVATAKLLVVLFEHMNELRKVGKDDRKVGTPNPDPLQLALYDKLRARVFDGPVGIAKLDDDSQGGAMGLGILRCGQLTSAR